MKDRILYSKIFRKNIYNLEQRNNALIIVSYNSIGVPEVLNCCKTIEEAKMEFDKLPGKSIQR